MEREDIIYLKETIDWLKNNSDLIDKSRTNCETLYARWANSMNILDHSLAEKKNISEKQLDAQPVFHKVFIIVHKERLIIHGVFSTEEKAKRYIKDSDSFGIIECVVN